MKICLRSSFLLEDFLHFYFDFINSLVVGCLDNFFSCPLFNPL